MQIPTSNICSDAANPPQPHHYQSHRISPSKVQNSKLHKGFWNEYLFYKIDNVIATTTSSTTPGPQEMAIPMF